MKKVIALLMCLFLAIGMVGCSAGGNPASSGEGQMNNVENDAAAENSSAETVKIAHIAGFTGSFATYSEFERKAAELMQEYINDNGGIKSLGGANVEFVYYDHMSDASQVPSVFERAVEDPDVIAVLSNNSSSVTTAMLAGMEKAGVSLLTINSAAALINQGYSYIFQNVFAASEVGATQVKFLQYMQENYGLDANKIGILFQDNDAGRDGGESSKLLAEGAGMQVVAFEAYPVGSADMSAPIVNLSNAGAEAVFLTGDINDLKQVISTMKQYEYNPIIIGGGAGFMVQEFAEALGDDAIGVLTASTYAYDAKHVVEDPTLSEVTELFHEKYGQYPSSYEMGVISQTLMLVEALEETASTNRDDIRDYLKSHAFTTYASGSPIQVNEAGASPDHVPMVCQWQKDENGEMVLSGVWPTEYASSELIK